MRRKVYIGLGVLMFCFGVWHGLHPFQPDTPAQLAHFRQQGRQAQRAWAASQYLPAQGTPPVVGGGG